MGSFGLGIILNFVDNATSGMNNATNTYLNMSNTIERASRTTNAALQEVASGNVLNALGTSFTNFGNSMMNVVSGLMNNVNRVGADFQAFRVTMNQLYGDSVETEKQLNKLLTFSVKSPFEVADTKDLLVVLKSQGIEAFNSIRGAITGVEQETLTWLSDLMAFKPDVPLQKWKLAFQNYIGSGEQKMLRNVLDMGQISEIIGHSIGSTTEERLNDIIEIVEKKNLRGLTESMMKTPTAVLSNISDFFTMFYKAIGDAGVFDSLFAILKSVSNLLNEFDVESGKLTKIAQIFSDAFNLILRPIISITEKATALVRSFLDFAIAHPAIAKVVIVLFALAGASTVALGWILRLSGSILMLAGSIKLLGGMKVIFSKIGAGIMTLGSKLLFLLPIAILIYQAWKNNFLGIQDIFKNTADKLELIWTYFKQGYFTDEQYNLAKQLGILGAIEKLAILRHFWNSFKTGFAKGWDKAFEVFFGAIEAYLKGIDAVLKSLGIDSGLSKLLDVLESGFDALFAVGNEKIAENLGALIGVISAFVITVGGAINIIKGATKVLNGIITVFKAVGGAFSWLYNLISGGIIALATTLHLSVGWVIAIIAAVIVAVVLLVKYWDQVCYFFTNTIPNAFKTAMTAIGNFFKAVWNAIINSPIVQAVIRVVKAIGSVIASILGVIKSVFNVIYQYYRAVFMGMVWVVMWVAKGIQSAFLAVWNFLKPILTAIGNAFISVWNWIKSVWSPVANFFSGIFTAIGDFALDVVDKIVGAFEWVANKVKSFFDWISGGLKKVGDFFKGIGDFFGGNLPTFATGVDSFSGGLAVINEQGGELVDLPRGTRVIPHDKSIKESLNEGIRLGARAMSAFNGINSNGTPVSNAPTQGAVHDNRVIFGKGSIVITTAGATIAEMEKAAEFIMKYIQRKQKLRALAVRS